MKCILLKNILPSWLFLQVCFEKWYTPIIWHCFDVNRTKILLAIQGQTESFAIKWSETSVIPSSLYWRCERRRLLVGWFVYSAKIGVWTVCLLCKVWGFYFLHFVVSNLYPNAYLFIHKMYQPFEFFVVLLTIRWRGIRVLTGHISSWFNVWSYVIYKAQTSNRVRIAFEDILLSVMSCSLKSWQYICQILPLI